MTEEELIKEATKYIDSRFKQEFFSYWDMLYSIVDVVRPREKRIAELKKENAKLNEQLSDIVECFQSASSGDDFEMAESAREIMEILDISCYRHGKVKSKLTEAKKIIKDMLGDIPNRMWYTDNVIKRAEDFIKE